MPDVAVKLTSISPELAKSMLYAYREYLKDKTVDKLPNYPLSRAELLEAFDVLISNNPLWGIDSQDPDKYRQVAEHLDNIADPQIKETATVPVYLEELKKAATQSEYDRQLSRLLVKQNLDRDLDRMRTVYSAQPPTQIPLEQEQKEAVVEAEKIISDGQGGYRERVYPVINAPGPRQEHQQRDVVHAWVEHDRIARIEEIIETANVPKEQAEQIARKVAEAVDQAQEKNQTFGAEELREVISQNLGQPVSTDQLRNVSDQIIPVIKEVQAPTPFFDLDKQGQRVARTVSYRTDETKEETSSEQTREERRDIREAKEALVLLSWQYRQENSLISGAYSQLALAFRQNQDNRQLLEEAVQTIEVRYPNFYSKNQIAIETLRANLDSILPPEETPQAIAFATEESLAQVLQTEDLSDAQVSFIRIDPERRRVSVEPTSIKQVQEKLGVKPVERVSQEVLQSVNQGRQNFFSNLQIAFKRFLSEDRFSTLRIGLSLSGLASLVLPVAAPIQILGAAAGGGLALNEARVSPLKALSGINMVRTGVGLLGKIGASAAWSALGASIGSVALPLGVILASIFIGIFVLMWLSNMGTHGTFLTETSFATLQSEYVSVSKLTPQNAFDNDKVPDELTFTIAVSPSKGKLTNVSVSDETTGAGKSLGSSKWDVGDMSTPWTQEYKVAIPADVKAGLKDSTILNTVTVTATAEGVAEKQTASTTITIRVGTPPDDCPSGWPTSGFVNQGPAGTVSHVFNNFESLDIHNSPGTPIKSTLKGIAKPVDYVDNSNGRPGYMVEVIGRCQGSPLRVTFVHLMPSGRVAPNTEVRPGDPLGKMDCSGDCISDHLHYEFRGAIKMAPPYIPVAIPRGCVGPAACGDVRF